MGGHKRDVLWVIHDTIARRIGVSCDLSQPAHELAQGLVHKRQFGMTQNTPPAKLQAFHLPPSSHSVHAGQAQAPIQCMQGKPKAWSTCVVSSLRVNCPTGFL